MPLENLPASGSNWHQASVDLIAHWKPSFNESITDHSVSASWPSLVGTKTRQTLVFQRPLPPVLLSLFVEGEWDLRSELVRRCALFSELQSMTIEIHFGSDMLKVPRDRQNHPPVPLSSYSDQIEISKDGVLRSWNVVRRDASDTPREAAFARGGTVAALNNLLKLTTPAEGPGVNPVDADMAHRTGFAALECAAAAGSRPAAPKGAWPGAPRGR